MGRGKRGKGFFFFFKKIFFSPFPFGGLKKIFRFFGKFFFPFSFFLFFGKIFFCFKKKTFCGGAFSLLVFPFSTFSLKRKTLKIPFAPPPFPPGLGNPPGKFFGRTNTNSGGFLTPPAWGQANPKGAPPPIFFFFYPRAPGGGPGCAGHFFGAPFGGPPFGGPRHFGVFSPAQNFAFAPPFWGFWGFLGPPRVNPV